MPHNSVAVLLASAQRQLTTHKLHWKYEIILVEHTTSKCTPIFIYLFFFSEILKGISLVWRLTFAVRLLKNNVIILNSSATWFHCIYCRNIFLFVILQTLCRQTGKSLLILHTSIYSSAISTCTRHSNNMPSRNVHSITVSCCAAITAPVGLTGFPFCCSLNIISQFFTSNKHRRLWGESEDKANCATVS